MSKLYIFGIGGTGSRVLKSLTMLLVAGVKCGVDTIVPIMIDPDEASADLTRTVEIMKKYTEVRKKLDFTSNDKNLFFKTKISESVQNFRFPLNNTRDLKFKEYMEVDTLSANNKALVNILFSQDNLDSNMKVGFKGNPNIGSVVLNQFSNSSEFKEFANSFEQGDSIFIVSSIFGGTGASGFPLLLKTLRSNTNIPNWSLIQNASIGAISVLPYFKVKQDDDSKIDSATFISKTKSALSYYERNISRTNSLDMLYYIADNDNSKAYENNEGGANQKNNAHFIELASALAIFDFASNNPQQNPQRQTIHKEFGIEKDSRQIIFGDMGIVAKDALRRALTQFLLCTKYLNEECSKEFKHQPWAIDGKFDKSFFNSTFYTDLKSVQKNFVTWLQEMDDNDRRFTPFDISKTDRIFEIAKGEEPIKLRCLSSNYALFDNELNKQSYPKNSTKEQQFLELFYQTTENLVSNKLNF